MTGIIILAAGASSRLGKPKQLLEFKKQTLLQHAIKEASLAGVLKPVVVLGAKAETIEPFVDKELASIAYNQAWDKGMSSSIKVGLTALLSEHPSAENVILMLCDQPFSNARLLKSMIDIKEAGEKGIVACAYGDTLGTPVLFGKKYFNELLHLEGRKGAKVLLKKYRSDAQTFHFPEGVIDIDTEEDYAKLSAAG